MYFYEENFAFLTIQRCLVKILIKLRECAGWSESLLGTRVQMYVVWCCGSYYYEYIPGVCAQRRFSLICTSAQSAQSRRCPPEETWLQNYQDEIAGALQKFYKHCCKRHHVDKWKDKRIFWIKGHAVIYKYCEKLLKNQVKPITFNSRTSCAL